MTLPNDGPPEVPPAATHPYGARLQLLLGSDVELRLEEEVARAKLADGTLLSLRLGHTTARENAAHLTRVAISFEGYTSAAEAERAGMRAAIAVLWAAVSKRFSMRLEHAVPLPATVYLRNSGVGLTARGEGRAYWPVTPSDLFGLVTEGLSTSVDPLPELLTALEFFASATLETTAAARFVMMMTALESLAVQREYGAPVEAIIAGLVEHVNASDDPAIEPAIRNSLLGRLRDLRRESVRQAILRTVRLHLADDEAVKFVDRAYASRSAILHTGSREPDLDSLITGLGEILRRIFVSILGLELRTPIFPRPVV